MALEGQLYPIGYLPTATEDQLGVVKIGSGVNIAVDGTLSVTHGVIARETKTLNTTSIADDVNLQTSLIINKTFICLQIQTDREARVRIYSNSTYQAADVSRPIGTDINYQTDHGLLCEVITDTGYLTVKLSPITIISTIMETATIPITVTNLSGSTSTVQVNFLIIPVE